MNQEQIRDFKRKFKELYETSLQEHNLKKIGQGKTVHMTIKIGGPYQIWFDDDKDHMNPLETEL